MKYYEATKLALCLSFLSFSYGFRSSRYNGDPTFAANVDASIPVFVTSSAIGSVLSPPDDRSYELTIDEVKAFVQFGKDETAKVINSFGIWCAVVSIITGPLWMFAMSILSFIYRCNNTIDPHRSLFDTTGKIWAKVWLHMTNCYPTFSGNLDHIKSFKGPCLYVANHASWMDIPVLCTVLDPVFKFIAKSELAKVPCIGQQLAGVSRGNKSLMSNVLQRFRLLTILTHDILQ
jgi:Acyltransferase